MLFNSYLFIFLFLPITLAGFYLLSQRQRQSGAIVWLVLCSFFFYSWWDPAYLLLLLSSILVNFVLGKHLTANPTRRLLALGVIFNLALLFYFKYLNFIVDSVNLVTGTGYSVEKILLPLAISFFTFQQIAYLVDAYRGLCREYRFLHYCLFVTFFPQLIAGPIVHHHEMLPQFARLNAMSQIQRNLAIGLTIFIIGLFKKVILADTFALYATPVFAMSDQGQSPDFFLAWQGALAYTFQLYFDFSGYSDMAIGLARMFGIRLPLNFNSPYKADNIIDFWRRWHMTLSRFLRDYLYIPLGGGRRGPLRRHVNLLITMLLGGIWHGAGVNFIIWGALHGSYLVINHAWQRLLGGAAVTGNVVYRFAARSVTMLAVVVGWVFFRAETTSGALNMLSAMCNLPNSVGKLLGPLAEPLQQAGLRFEGGYLAHEHLQGSLIFLLAILFVWFWPNTQQWMGHYRPSITPVTAERLRWRPTFAYSGAIAILAVTSILALTNVSEFLYFQF